LYQFYEYGFRGGRIDIAETVQVAKDAVAAEPQDSLEKANYFNGLDIILVEKFKVLITSNQPPTGFCHCCHPTQT
jgi:hypothetical protein